MNFNILNKLFGFVMSICSTHNIDESHGLSHSMDVLNYANNIYEAEKNIYPELKEQEDIIYISAILHDVCDKKYMNEEEGLKRIEDFIEKDIEREKKEIILKIISTMSYSKVKKDGFPDLGIYQRAYHCVREADLLSAYNFDRCIVYDMYTNGNTFEKSFEKAENLFRERVFKHDEDDLFTTQYSLSVYPSLHLESAKRINSWKNIIKIR